MDCDWKLERECRFDGTLAETIGSSIDERKKEVVENVIDSVSGGFANDVKMSAVASCCCDGGMIYEVNGFLLDVEEGMVESGLDFTSGGENGALDFSDVEEKREMAGNLVEFEANCKKPEIFPTISVLKGKKEFEVCETLESSAEAQGKTVFGHEDRNFDGSLDAKETQYEVNNILGSTDQSQDCAEKRNVVKSEIVSIPVGEATRDYAESQEILEGLQMAIEKLGMVEVQEFQNADRGSSSRGNCGSCVTEITELQDIVDERSENHVENCLHGKVEQCPSSVTEAGNGCGRKERVLLELGKKRTGSSSVNMNTKQEVAEKKETRHKRRGKSQRKVSEMTGNENFCLKKCTESKRNYSRKEMETLRYVNVEGQTKLWNKIYLGLGPAVSRELDNMAGSKLQNQGHKNVNHRQNFGKKICNGGPILREECSQIEDHYFKGNISGKAGPHSLKDNFKEVTTLYINNDDQADGEYANCLSAEDYDEESSSDEVYNSVQKPAFFVEGDPSFESGTPEDGLEYLRRVRWEAKHIPKVKVAKVDISKISNEQTVYMPEIPDIAKCPEHLMPSKEWEDAFLADFLELRLTLSQFEGSEQQNMVNLQSHLSIDGDDSCSSDPKLSTVLAMDHVSRSLMLKNCIRSLESMSNLRRNDCAWLFTLCAAVDTPLDADMAASLRALLRKCSNLLAGKSEFDDEVVMLNILVRISGKYFKQSEN